MSKQEEKSDSTWVVCGLDGYITQDEDDNPEEFDTEKEAIERAKEWIDDSTDNKAYVYRLSHIVSRPRAEPEIKEIG